MVCDCLDLSVSSSSWGLGRVLVCDCGTPWTFLLPFLQVRKDFLGEMFSNQRYLWTLIQNDGDQNLEKVLHSCGLNISNVLSLSCSTTLTCSCVQWILFNILITLLGRGGRLLWFVFGLWLGCCLSRGLFALPLGVIGRQC